MKKRTVLSIIVCIIFAMSCFLFYACSKDKDKGENKPHTHTFASEWSYDINNHWHTSTCGHDVKDAIATHTGGTATTEHGKICEVCGCEYTAPRSEHTHTYGTITYTWTGNDTKCTASRTCSSCLGEEKETATAVKNVTQNKSCTLDELSTMTATFENTAFIAQIKENVKTDVATGHSYGEITYTWTENDTKCTASRTCSSCLGEEKETATAVKNVTQNKSCTLDELSTMTATFENTAFIAQTKENVKTDVATGHSFATDWSFDDTYHWHASTCGHETEVNGKTEHSFTDYGLCECGKYLNTPDYVYWDYNELPEGKLYFTFSISIYQGKDIFSFVTDFYDGDESLYAGDSYGTEEARQNALINNTIIYDCNGNIVPTTIMSGDDFCDTYGGSNDFYEHLVLNYELPAKAFEDGWYGPFYAVVNVPDEMIGYKVSFSSDMGWSDYV